MSYGKITPPSPFYTPIDMILHCPKCGVQHIDRDESPSDREWAALPSGDREVQYWTNPPHRSHLCGACGCIWRPADVPTNGVRAIATSGKADTWAAYSKAAPYALVFDTAAPPEVARWLSSHPPKSMSQAEEPIPDCGEAGHDDGCCGNLRCIPRR